jgi:methanogenic corrinoid protein MtbC1
MENPSYLIDSEAFVRTASLFVAKRKTLGPAAVEALAYDIVARVARSARFFPRYDDVVVCEASLSDFCDALVNPAPDAALQFIEQLRSEGTTREEIYLGYIAAAARELGERWTRDRVSFMQVTVGTGHLYALMRAIRADPLTTRPSSDTRRSALFATVPGEQHGIGITIAAHLFREAGWEIDLQISTDHDCLVARTESTCPAVIGLSLSTEQQLEGLVRLVVAMRIVQPHAIIGVAPGSSLDKNTITGLADIDMVFEDARAALRDLDRLIRLRS